MDSASGLVVRDVEKTYPTRAKPILSNVNFSLPYGERLALLGRNGQGKSTLIKILGGVLKPSSGEISWRMTSSWPIGFGGGFQGSLSGIDNIKFISRIYDRNYDEVLESVESFAELGSALKRPVKHYSSGMRARLAFGLSLTIEFDCYLIDELVAVGDARFQRKCEEELFNKRKNRSYIMASHDLHLISSHCKQALIIESGMAKMFHDVEEAIDVYSWLRSR